MILKVAERYFLSEGNFEDLKQEGFIGLCRAIERFDWKQGNRFSTYAYHWIRSSMIRYVQDRMHTVRIPSNKHDLIYRIRQEEIVHESMYGEKPDIKFLSSKLDVAEDQIEDAYRCFGMMIMGTTDSVVKTSEGEASLSEVLDDKKAQEPFEKVLWDMDYEEFWKIIKEAITESELDVLSKRLGFTDGKPMTLQEIGDEYGCTREWVRQIETSAYRKLRHPKYRYLLKGFLA